MQHLPKSSYLFIGFFIFLTNNVFGANSLCNLSEDIIFSCDMKNNKKLSICSKVENGQLTINYKYGELKNIEMIFPKQNAGNNTLFKYNHYIRYQTDYFRLAFKNNDYLYEIYRNYDGNKVNAGVIVSEPLSSRPYDNMCKTIEIDNISNVSKYINCDTDYALGCASAE